MKNNDVLIKVCLFLLTIIAIIFIIYAISFFSKGIIILDEIEVFTSKLQTINIDKINSIINNIDEIDLSNCNETLTNLNEFSKELKTIDFEKLNKIIIDGEKTVSTFSSMFGY